MMPTTPPANRNFYPRSPCGERPEPTFNQIHIIAYFYPRSPCGERRRKSDTEERSQGISIHALLAESDTWQRGSRITYVEISIHALLAESDYYFACPFSEKYYFYPRSPCGERLHYDNYNLHCVEISIHALLAESDHRLFPRQSPEKSFLSTLSLRRATTPPCNLMIHHAISIHALLAESDAGVFCVILII